MLLSLNSIACSNGTDCAEGIALRQICANRGFHLPGPAAGIGNERSDGGPDSESDIDLFILKNISASEVRDFRLKLKLK